MLGYEDHEISNHVDSWKKLIHPDGKKRVMAKVRSHTEGKTPIFESEHRMLHKDGSGRWLLFRGSIVEDINGKKNRMAGTVTDITELKHLVLL